MSMQQRGFLDFSAPRPDLRPFVEDDSAISWQGDGGGCRCSASGQMAPVDETLSWVGFDGAPTNAEALTPPVGTPPVLVDFPPRKPEGPTPKPPRDNRTGGWLPDPDEEPRGPKSFDQWCFEYQQQVVEYAEEICERRGADEVKDYSQDVWECTEEAYADYLATGGATITVDLVDGVDFRCGDWLAPNDDEMIPETEPDDGDYRWR